MRDLLVCLTAVMIVGGAVSVGPRYVATQEHERDLQQIAVAPVPALTNQYLAEAGYEPKTWTDFGAALAQKQPAAAMNMARAEAQPRLGHNTFAAKPEAQPTLAAPVMVQAPPAKPEKKMVGPDGVVFVRAAKAPAVVRVSRPVAPEAVGQAAQAKAVETMAVASATRVEPETVSAPQLDQAAVVAVNAPAADKGASQFTGAKPNPVMVGPDGVIYRPADRAPRP
jgi:hypothetical protein